MRTPALSLLLLASCSVPWWPEQRASAWVQGAAPRLRVAVVQPVEMEGLDEGITTLQVWPLTLMELPLFWGALPAAMALAIAPTIPQVVFQHDPSERALSVLSYEDPAFAARDAFIEAWNSAGHQPRAEAVDADLPDYLGAPAALRDPDAGALLIFGTIHLALYHTKDTSMGGFEIIPERQPAYAMALAVGTALFEDGADAPLWCRWGDETPFLSRPLAAPLSPRADMRVDATMAQWTSGGGQKLDAKLRELGRVRGLEVARELAEAQDKAATTAPVTSLRASR